MDIRKFKACSIEQLEEAIAKAITSLTNGEAEVKISLVREVSGNKESSYSKEKFELELTATCRTTTPEDQFSYMGSSTLQDEVSGADFLPK